MRMASHLGVHCVLNMFSNPHQSKCHAALCPVVGTCDQCGLPPVHWGLERVLTAAWLSRRRFQRTCRAVRGLGMMFAGRAGGGDSSCSIQADEGRIEVVHVQRFLATLHEGAALHGLGLVILDDFEQRDPQVHDIQSCHKNLTLS